MGSPRRQSHTGRMSPRGSLIASLSFAMLTLVPAGAHLMSLPNKIGMSGADYLVAQQAYAGWNLSAIVVIGALVSTALFAWQSRDAAQLMALASIAFVCMIGTQLVFWTLNFPANQQTSNWTQLPAHWRTLRLRWELGHATSAVLNLAALAALLTALARLLRSRS